MSPLCLFVAAVGLAAPAPGTPATDSVAAAARKALAQPLDVDYRDRTLAELAADLKDKFGVPVILDTALDANGIDPTTPAVNLTRKGKARDVLAAALAPVNLKAGVTRDGLVISTEEGLIARQLRQAVSVDCDGTRIDAALKGLSAETGANLVLDPRLTEFKTVRLQLDDVPLETAVRLIAEVADLRAVRMGNVLFVTTKERGKDLREDADGPVPVPPVMPGLPGGVGGGPGIALPAPVPVPAVPAPAAPPAKEEKPAEKK